MGRLALAGTCSRVFVVAKLSVRSGKRTRSDSGRGTARPYLLTQVGWQEKPRQRLGLDRGIINREKPPQPPTASGAEVQR